MQKEPGFFRPALLLTRLLCLYRLEVQVLIIEAEIGEWGDGHHREVIDPANRVQREGDEGVFDRAVAPVSLESVVLPDLKIRNRFWRVVESEHQPCVLKPDGRGAIPSVVVDSGVLIQWQGRLGNREASIALVDHDLGGYFLSLICCGLGAR